MQFNAVNVARFYKVYNEKLKRMGKSMGRSSGMCSSMVQHNKIWVIWAHMDHWNLELEASWHVMTHLRRACKTSQEASLGGCFVCLTCLYVWTPGLSVESSRNPLQGVFDVKAHGLKLSHRIMPTITIQTTQQECHEFGFAQTGLPKSPKTSQVPLSEFQFPILYLPPRLLSFWSMLGFETGCIRVMLEIPATHICIYMYIIYIHGNGI